MNYHLFHRLGHIAWCSKFGIHTVIVRWNRQYTDHHIDSFFRCKVCFLVERLAWCCCQLNDLPKQKTALINTSNKTYAWAASKIEGKTVHFSIKIQIAQNTDTREELTGTVSLASSRHFRFLDGAVRTPVQWTKKYGLRKGNQVCMREDKNGFLSQAPASMSNSFWMAMLDARRDISCWVRKNFEHNITSKTKCCKKKVLVQHEAKSQNRVLSVPAVLGHLNRGQLIIFSGCDRNIQELEFKGTAFQFRWTKFCTKPWIWPITVVVVNIY